MKRLMRTALLILIGVTMTTVILDKGEQKYTLIERIEETIEERLDEYIIPDYELEVVDEYILAMEGFIC